MREIRQSGSEGGARFDSSFLPLSKKVWEFFDRGKGVKEHKMRRGLFAAKEEKGARGKRSRSFSNIAQATQILHNIGNEQLCRPIHSRGVAQRP